MQVRGLQQTQPRWKRIGFKVTTYLNQGASVVLAPFGISSVGDVEDLTGALGGSRRGAIVVVPAGRPTLAAESVGLSVLAIRRPSSVTGLLQLGKTWLGLRRAVRASGREVCLWAEGVALKPYEEILDVGARMLGARFIVTLDRARPTRRHLTFSLRRPLSILLMNIRAYRATRDRERSLHGLKLVARSSTAVKKVLYVRTDLAFIQSTKPGGTESHTEGIVGGLLDNGLEVTALAGRPVPCGTRPDPEWIEIRPETPSNMHVELQRAWADDRLQPLLLERAPHDADVIYARYSYLNTSVAALAKERGIPLILEFNCSEAKFEAGGKRMRFERVGSAIEAELCAAASLVVVVSERVADEVRALAPTARILVSPNGVDADLFVVGDEVRDIERSRMGVGQDDVLIGFVGRFYVWHGVDTLADAAARVLAERPNARLLMIGDGPRREAALRKLSPWGERVIAPGIVDHSSVPRLMAACDVLVSPHAPIEGFVGSPMKLFEYMASGRAIVASRLEQLAEIIEDGRTGLLITPGDVDDLFAAMLTLVDDATLRDSLGKSARRTALSEHTWEARVKAIIEAISSE